MPRPCTDPRGAGEGRGRACRPLAGAALALSHQQQGWGGSIPLAFQGPPTAMGLTRRKFSLGQKLEGADSMRTKQKNTTDWNSIRDQWQRKTLSNRVLAKLFSVDERAIRARAKRHGWKRFAENESAGANQARTADRPSDAWPGSTVSPAVAALSDDIDPAQLAMAGRHLVSKLATELADACRGGAVLIGEVLDAEQRGERHPRRREMLTKLVSVGTRASAVRNLCSSMGLLANASGGKKAEADAEAKRVGEDDDWGGLLNPPSPKRKPN